MLGSDEKNMSDVLDAAQLKRIESVHRGFVTVRRTPYFTDQ